MKLKFNRNALLRTLKIVGSNNVLENERKARTNMIKLINRASAENYKEVVKNMTTSERKKTLNQAMSTYSEVIDAK